MWENFWLKILDLRGDILAALFFGSVVILMLANGHMFYADELPRPVLGGISALAVITFFLWLIKLIMVGAAAIKKKLSSRALRLNELGVRALRLSRRISETSGFHTEDSALQSFRVEIVSIFLHLRKDGFEAPLPKEGATGLQVLNQCAEYLDGVGRMLVEGHLKEAESMAKFLTEKFNSPAKKK